MIRVKQILIILLLLLICFLVKRCNSINNNMENFFSLEQDIINLYKGFPTDKETTDLKEKVDNLKMSPIYNIIYKDIEDKLRLIYGDDSLLSQTKITEVKKNIDSLVLDFNKIKYEIYYYNNILRSLETKTGSYQNFLNPFDNKKKEIKEDKEELLKKFQAIKTTIEEIEKQNTLYVDKYTYTLSKHINDYMEDLTKSEKALKDLTEKLNTLDKDSKIKSLPIERNTYSNYNRKILIVQYSKILDKTNNELYALIKNAPDESILRLKEYSVGELIKLYNITITSLKDILTKLKTLLENPTTQIYYPEKIGFIDNTEPNSLVDALYFWMSLKIGSPEYFVINKINSNSNPYVLPETTQDKTNPYKITGSCNAKESISKTPKTPKTPNTIITGSSNTKESTPENGSSIVITDKCSSYETTAEPTTNYKLLFNSIFTPIRDDLNQIQKSYNNYQIVSPTTTISTVSDLKNEKEEEEAKHQVLLNKITELESALKKELEKGEDWDISIISSLEESLNNQTEKLVKLAEINNITDSNNKYATELNAIKTKLHESQELLKSQTSRITELLKKPKTPITVSEINKLKKSMINVEKIIETQASSLSNTVTKTRNKYYKRKINQVGPLNTNNTHHDKLNRIIESLNKHHIKSMDEETFNKLNLHYNNLNNLDKSQLLGLLTSILEVKVNRENSKEIEDIASYTNKLIESKTNINNYNKNENEILIMEISKALRKGTLTKISDKDRKLILSTPNNKLWKQILKLNEKYSEPIHKKTEKHIPGFYHIHPDKW